MDPGCAEAVDEVCLAGDDGGVEVGVGEFADVDLEDINTVVLAREGPTLGRIVDRNGGGRMKRTYRILIRIKPTSIEPAIRTTETQRMRRPIRVLRPQISKINIINPEIFIPKRRILRNCKPRRARPRQTRIQRRGHDEHAGKDIIDALPRIVVVRSGPGDGHTVAGWIIRMRGLAEEGDWGCAGDVELFVVGAGEDEDGLGGGVVWEGVYGCLDGCVVCEGVGGGDDDCVVWAGG